MSISIRQETAEYLKALRHKLRIERLRWFDAQTFTSDLLEAATFEGYLPCGVCESTGECGHEADY